MKLLRDGMYEDDLLLSELEIYRILMKDMCQEKGYVIVHWENEEQMYGKVKKMANKDVETWIWHCERVPYIVVKECKWHRETRDLTLQKDKYMACAQEIEYVPTADKLKASYWHNKYIKEREKRQKAEQTLKRSYQNHITALQRMIYRACCPRVNMPDRIETVREVTLGSKLSNEMLVPKLRRMGILRIKYIKYYAFVLTPTRYKRFFGCVLAGPTQGQEYCDKDNDEHKMWLFALVCIHVKYIYDTQKLIASCDIEKLKIPKWLSMTQCVFEM